MPRVRILTGVCLGGGKDAAPGEEVDVSRSLAIDLVNCDQAKYITEPETLREVTVIQERDPKPINRDPKLPKG